MEEIGLVTPTPGLVDVADVADVASDNTYLCCNYRHQLKSVNHHGQTARFCTHCGLTYNISQ